MKREYDAICDEVTPTSFFSKHGWVNRETFEDEFQSFASNGDPIIVSSEWGQTVVRLTIAESITDNYLHLDEKSAQEVGVMKNETIPTEITLQHSNWGVAEQVQIENTRNLTKEILNMKDILKNDIRSALEGIYILPGDEFHIPRNKIGIQHADFRIDAISGVSESGVGLITEETNITTRLRLDKQLQLGEELITRENKENVEMKDTNNRKINGERGSDISLRSNHSMSKSQNSETKSEESGVSVTWDDIGGLHNKMQRIKEVIQRPLTDPEAFRNVDRPKGVLLHGPPGTGKTLIAQAVANEIDANFYQISGGELFDSGYGNTEENIKEVFAEARNNQPAILFIDEIDTIAGSRESLDGSQDLERRVVNTLKEEIDGFIENDLVTILGATNNKDAIDNALLRHGRFGISLEIGVPNAAERREILEIHLNDLGVTFDSEFMDEIIEMTHGYTGADIEALCWEANMEMQRRLLREYGDDYYDPENNVSAIRKDQNEGVSKEDFRNAADNISPTLLNKYDIEKPDTTWEDIGGQEKTVDRIRDLVEGPLKHPELYDKDENKSEGILLYGPPGTGKTSIARAMANESERVFISIDAPSLRDKYVGETERQIRKLMSTAKKLSPSILYIDEIDSITEPRSGNSSRGTINSHFTQQFLSALDDIRQNSDVVVVGSTNAEYDPEERLVDQTVENGIDDAILRSGRIDTHFYIGMPDEPARRDIFRIYLEKYLSNSEKFVVDGTVDVSEIAKRAEGLSGADIENVVQNTKQMKRREFIRVANEEKENQDVEITISNQDLLTSLNELLETEEKQTVHSRMSY